MAQFTLTGEDTITINGEPIIDVGDGDIGTITFPNELISLKNGKNGNGLYSANVDGKQVNMELRVLRGSKNDKFLNSLKIAMTNDFASFTLLTGSFVKRLGDGAGNITLDSYALNGGVFSQEVDGKTNVSGDTDQSIALYRFKFTSANRTLE